MSSRRGGCAPASGSGAAALAHRRRRLTCSPCSARRRRRQRRMGLDERHAQGAPPGRARRRRSCRAKPVVRTMPAVTRGIHVSEPWAGDGKPGYLDSVLAQAGPQPGSSSTSRTRAARSPAWGRHARPGQELRRRARLLRPRARRAASRTTSTSGSLRASSASRTRSWRPATRRSRSTSSEGGVVARRRRQALAQPVQPWRLEVPHQPRQSGGEAGVDEVQFDYVRFPSEGDLSTERFPGKVNEPMNATIPRFLAAARKALKPFDVKVGVDVFGLAADHDLGIGQDVALIAKHVDVDLADALPEPLHRGRARHRGPERRPEQHRRALDGHLPLAARSTRPTSRSGPGCRTSAATACRRSTRRRTPRCARGRSAGCSGTRPWTTRWGSVPRRAQASDGLRLFAAVGAKLPSWPVSRTESPRPLDGRHRLRHRRDEVRRFVGRRRRQGARRRTAPRRGQGAAACAWSAPCRRWARRPTR